MNDYQRDIEMLESQQAGCTCRYDIIDVENKGKQLSRFPNKDCLIHHKPKNEAPVRAGHPLFYALLAELAELHEKKNNNYARDSDPLSNLRECRSIGINPSLGVLIRLQDKWSRIEELMKGKPDLVGESLEDTLKDNAVYSLLMIILLREERKCQTTSQE